LKNAAAVGAAIAALTLTGCTHTPTPTDKAKEACNIVGLNGRHHVESNGNGVAPDVARRFAADLDRARILAGEAAHDDDRWLQLSGSMSVLALTATQIKVEAERTDKPALAPDPEATWLVIRSVETECFKAQPMDADKQDTGDALDRWFNAPLNAIT
jgi:hypothetical protein